MICILKHINVIEVLNGIEYHYKSDSEGIEIGEPISMNKDGSPMVWPGGNPDDRQYMCTNCLRRWDGTETFDEVRAHLGKPYDA